MNDAAHHPAGSTAPELRRPRGAAQHADPYEQRGAVLDDRICWSTVAGLSLIHVAGIVGMVWVVVHPSVGDARAGGVLYALCGLAITSGYHRLFAHRTYRASPPVRWAMLAFGAATFQNSALSWSADHRAHHADTDGAERSPRRHPGGLVRPRGLAVPPAGRRPPTSARLGDLWAVRSIRWQHRFYRRWRSRSGSCSRWRSPRRGAIPGAASSSPASSASPSCCRRRSPSTRSPTSSGTRRYDAAVVGTRQHVHGARHLR